MQKLINNAIKAIALMLLTTTVYGADISPDLKLTCQDYNWSDVETLVEPYLDDTLFTTLVMQGQSASYKTSEAASQAMDDSLPDVIKRILQALIKADCK